MPALDHLASLFYDDLALLGHFEEIVAEAMPEPYRGLLAHHQHMTVAMERHHGGPVEVQVLTSRRDGEYYSRKIVLRRHGDGRVVLFGIPRLNLQLLDEAVRQELLAERKPLGRLLIEHGVLREVQLASLYRVQLGPDLARLFQRPLGETTYGRTAFLYCDGYLAVELLEIVAPEACFGR
jgi:chorismate-pyruvate lyase